MKLRLLIALSTAAFATSTVFAQAPASTPAPAGTTGVCKDGSFSSTATKRGACAGHKGVKEWFAAGAETPAGATAAKTPASATATGMASAPSTAVVPATPASRAAPSAATGPATGSPAAGGGPGMVWVNSSSKVYHCSGTKYYGTTKAGSYMSEAAAKTAGAHADHGKACG